MDKENKYDFTLLELELHNAKWCLERHKNNWKFRYPWRSIDGAYWDWRSERALDELERGDLDE